MRASVYARISRDRVGAGLGVATQEQDCRDLAASLGWSIVAVHTDNDISAYSGKRRPGYQALLQQMEAGEVDAVLAWHTDRLHRSPVELEEYVTLSEQHRVTTQTVKAGHIDLGTPSGRLVARQLGAVARYEVEHSIERQRRAKTRSAHAGKWKGGRRPYGYEADGVTVVPLEAAHIREATSDLLAGTPLRGLVREWNQAGRRTTMGNPWAHNSLRTTLLRPRNAGLMVHRGEIIGKAGWEPIVPEMEWRALVDYLNAPGRQTNLDHTARRWLGSGLYRCHCGETVLCSGSNGYPSYRCRACGKVARRQSSLDPYVEEIVAGRLRTMDLADVLDGRPSVPDGLEQEAVALRTRLDSLAGMFAQGVIDAQQLAEGTRSINARLEAVRAEINGRYRGTSLASVAGASDPGAVWLDLPLDRKRAVLDALVTVVLLPDRVGRPAGWRPGMPYFRPDAVRFDWRV